ncbi:uncharacterized protein LOC129759120, partial [Uranotaenia lowii]|uniref:uncharacterized protein LOC129759120 n=1 Tax=Uranotaenia lowii TaxID=190385 RepID=UPI002479B81D
PSPLASRSATRGQKTEVGGVIDEEGGSFAYDINNRGYGSLESIYFDARVRKQHKIDPLRSKFDGPNVVLVDWGGKCDGGGVAKAKGRKGIDGICDRVVDTANNSIKQGGMIESEKFELETTKEEEEERDPPVPPPRKYFLTMEHLQSGVGIEIMLRCHGTSFNRNDNDESQEIPLVKIDDISDNCQQASKIQHQTDDGTILQQDGIQTKPPVKIKRTLTKPPTTPTHFGHQNHPAADHNCAHDANEDSNINSNMIPNLNIDNASTAPLILVTDCHQQQAADTEQWPLESKQNPIVPLLAAKPKTNDRLFDEIIDENHNYNEKLITNSGRFETGLTSRLAQSFPIMTPSALTPENFPLSPAAVPTNPLLEDPHTKLNVSNQPNRNWINLNSNEIYTEKRARTSPGTANEERMSLMTQTRVPGNSEPPSPWSTTILETPPECHHFPNDDDPTTMRMTSLGADVKIHQHEHPLHNNYGSSFSSGDNKSVKSNYRITTAAVATPPPPIPPPPTTTAPQEILIQRSASRDSVRSSSSSSRRIEPEMLDFPPPPPYLCLCEEGSPPSGRCSVERPPSSANSRSGVGGGSGHPEEVQICDDDDDTDNHNIRSIRGISKDNSSSNRAIQYSHASRNCQRDLTADDWTTFHQRNRSGNEDNNTEVPLGLGQQSSSENRGPQLRRLSSVARDGNYFKTNLTADKFLSEFVADDDDGVHQAATTTTAFSQPEGPPSQGRRPSSKVENFNPLHKSIGAFISHERRSTATTTPPPSCSCSPPPTTSRHLHQQTTPGTKNSPIVTGYHQVSFTDGEYIFGPFDDRSEECRRFEVWCSSADAYGYRHRKCHHFRPNSRTGLPAEAADCRCCSECRSQSSRTESVSSDATTLVGQELSPSREPAVKTPEMRPEISSWMEEFEAGKASTADDDDDAGGENGRFFFPRFRTLPSYLPTIVKWDATLRVK